MDIDFFKMNSVFFDEIYLGRGSDCGFRYFDNINKFYNEEYSPNGDSKIVIVFASEGFDFNYYKRFFCDADDIVLFDLNRAYYDWFRDNFVTEAESVMNHYEHNMNSFLYAYNAVSSVCLEYAGIDSNSITNCASDSTFCMSHIFSMIMNKVHLSRYFMKINRDKLSYKELFAFTEKLKIKNSIPSGVGSEKKKKRI